MHHPQQTVHHTLCFWLAGQDIPKPSIQLDCLHQCNHVWLCVATSTLYKQRAFNFKSYTDPYTGSNTGSAWMHRMARQIPLQLVNVHSQLLLQSITIDFNFWAFQFKGQCFWKKESTSLFSSFPLHFWMPVTVPSMSPMSILWKFQTPFLPLNSFLIIIWLHMWSLHSCAFVLIFWLRKPGNLQWTCVIIVPMQLCCSLLWQNLISMNSYDTLIDAPKYY